MSAFRKSTRQDSRLSRKGPGERKGKKKNRKDNIRSKRQARGLREDAGKPSKRLEPRKNFGVKDKRADPRNKRKGKPGPMRKFGEEKAKPRFSKRQVSDDRPRYGRERTEPRDRPRFKREKSDSRDKPNYRRTKDRTDERPRQRAKPREESRGRKMSNRAQNLKNASQGFKKFVRETKEKKPKGRQPHQATCDNCGKRCEVPFKPTGIKPVYCSECHNKRKD